MRISTSLVLLFTLMPAQSLAADSTRSTAPRLPSISAVKKDPNFLSEGIYQGTGLMVLGGLAGAVVGVFAAEGVERMRMFRQLRRSDRTVMMIMTGVLTGLTAGTIYGAGLPARRRGGECGVLSRWWGMLAGTPIALSVPIFGVVAPAWGATLACRRDFGRFAD